MREGGGERSNRGRRTPHARTYGEEREYIEGERAGNQLLGRALLFVFNSYLIYFLRLREASRPRERERERERLATAVNEMEGADTAAASQLFSFLPPILVERRNSRKDPTVKMDTFTVCFNLMRERELASLRPVALIVAKPI